ncbi:hypothetical protein BLOT_014991 [Blomia tropicalis]|nr:hypothetical protein BLOT_014991 [Blomia tropicalis]
MTTISLHDDLLPLSENGGDKKEKLIALSDLQFVRFLNVSSKTKRVCVECLYHDEPAIIIMEKTQFDESFGENVASNFSSSLSSVKNLFRNDIYGTYFMQFVSKDSNDELNNLNQLFVSIIHPAKPNDIEKYLDHDRFLVQETGDHYRSVTKPFIDEQVSMPGHLQWVYNVLEHKAETDRIIHEENMDNNLGFMLCKDMKWKCENDQHLTDTEKVDIYCSAIVVRRDLHSLRDLTNEHLPLLEAIYERGRQVLADKYSIDPQQFRVFIHYQPSFYHLHVHFTHIKAEHIGFQAERSHMLSTVIANIRLMSDYYQRITLEFPLSTASKLKRELYIKKYY